MNFKFALLALILMWGVGMVRASVLEQDKAAGKTVWDGVYTEEQAARGDKAFKEACSECHGNDLAGDGFAPALTGSEFGNAWNTLSVGDLFERIRVSMPPSNPNAVSNAQKVDIVAYILQANKMPAGTTELPQPVEQLKAIQYLALKPGL